MLIPDPIAIEFDFAVKIERVIPVSEAATACAAGQCCWIDLDVRDRALVETTLRALGVNDVAIEEALTREVDGRHDLYEECVHVAVTAPSFDGTEIRPRYVDLIIGERFIITLRRGRVEFLEQVRKSYRQDFLQFAQTIGFLLYEFWDHLIDSYRRLFRHLEERVSQVQRLLFNNADDQIFTDAARVTQDVLEYRKSLLAAREVLHELAVRRSPFVSPTTQPFLENMVGTLSRLGSDLAVERDIIGQTLNLYLGMVSHRTNRVVNRLTVLNIIFLPLTFLCGVYGMNFENLPETKWQYGYLFFWAIAVTIAGGLLTLVRVRRWL